MDEPIKRDGIRVLATFPGLVTGIEAAGDYIVVKTVAGDFLTSIDGITLPMAEGGIC